MMAAAILCWWEYLWIFAGLLMKWGMRANRSLCGWHLSCYSTTHCSTVNLLWWNVSIAPTHIYHTHDNGLIHITHHITHMTWPNFPMFILYEWLPKKSRLWQGVNPDLLLHWMIWQQMASFVCVRTCSRVHIKQHPCKMSEEKQTDKWKKRWPEMVSCAHTTVVAARSGWIALRRLSPHHLVWSQSSCIYLWWKQSWPFPARGAAGYELKRVVILVLASPRLIYIAFSCCGAI